MHCCMCFGRSVRCECFLLVSPSCGTWPVPWATPSPLSPCVVMVEPSLGQGESGTANNITQALLHQDERLAAGGVEEGHVPPPLLSHSAPGGSLMGCMVCTGHCPATGPSQQTWETWPGGGGGGSTSPC